MDTAYKTRTWWMLRALSYADGCYNAFGDWDRAVDHRQISIWESKAVECGRNAMAPAGAECLTRRYVDRSGNLLETTNDDDATHV